MLKHVTDERRRERRWIGGRMQDLISDRPSGSRVMRAALSLALIFALLSACAPEPAPPAGTLSGLEVDPDTISLPAGLSTPLRAFGLYDDGTRVDRTAEVEWINSSPQFAELDAAEPGLVHGLLPGTTAISATLGNFAAGSIVEVVDAELLGLVVTPLSAELAVGQWVDLVATGLGTDGGHSDLTGSVLWTSSVPGVADFDPEEPRRLVARSPGSSTVRAALGGVEAAALVQVVDRELMELTLTPASLELPLGTEGALVAWGRWTDGLEEDLSAQAAWTSSNEQVASVGGGLVSSVGTGTSLVEARLFGVEGPALVTVGPPAEVGLEVEPDQLTLVLGQEGALQAWLRFSDDSEQDVTDAVLWSSTDPAVVSASNDLGREGLVVSVGQGAATVRATRGELSAFAAVTIAAAELVSIAVEPPSLELALGDAGGFAAVGTWSDGATADLTGSVAWTIDPLGVAGLGAGGAVLALSPGAATVTATSGAVSADAALTVGPAELRSIAVTPVDLVLPVGAEQPLVAAGTWSDGGVSDVTGAAFWGSSAPGFASVTNLLGQEGVVTGEGPGQATILASIPPVSGSVVVDVVPAAPSSLEILLPAPLLVGASATLELLVLWTDGSDSFEVEDASWSSSDPAVLTTSNDVGLEGTILGVSPGLATVYASFEDLDASLVVEVIDPS